MLLYAPFHRWHSIEKPFVHSRCMYNSVWFSTHKVEIIIWHFACFHDLKKKIFEDFDFKYLKCFNGKKEHLVSKIISATFAITVFMHQVALLKFCKIHWFVFGQLRKMEKHLVDRKGYQGEADTSCKIRTICILKLLFFPHVIFSISSQIAFWFSFSVPLKLKEWCLLFMDSRCLSCFSNKYNYSASN